ncbi:cupin domain-containing protein [Candidatus Kaiserbacteria bacterium]|nr:cupin domain-containing protein [Candidatus Kaiserbacteria bacterium]
MKGYCADIDKETVSNENFRRVVYTAHNCQLVVMSLKPGEDIGEEVHDVDQFIRCETGDGTAVLDGVEHTISDGFAVLVPAGTKHNIKNSADTPMKLYTIYAPPHHLDGVIHATKADALADEGHDKFEGKTTE